MMTGAEVQKQFTEAPDSVAKIFAKALEDFGYAGVTNELVRECLDKLAAGEPVHPGATGVFVQGWWENGIS